ncbi:MAG: AbrB/MazE/SpoVT family DNA-binding domain-containing protein [Gemmatimonadaceae bacterium]|nr:AbrB/MazE/SpoVT family DNA-binding domain-containing protein [Gemmatimonadaceae bacterium]
MLTTINRWGNSLAIRIPKAFAEQAEMEENTPVEKAVEGDRITIQPVRKTWTLPELLAGVTDTNQHPETDWGEITGREVW